MNTYEEYYNGSVSLKKELISSHEALLQTLVKELEIYERKDSLCANLRLGFFLGMIVCLISGLYGGEAAGARTTILYSLAGVFVISFLSLIHYHDKIIILLEKARARVVLKKERLERVKDVERPVAGVRDSMIHETVTHEFLDGTFGFSENPSRFELSEHIINDLDLFEGGRNIFGLYCTAQTAPGKQRLYQCLRSPFMDAKTIKERQAAVEELSKDAAFIEAAAVEAFPMRNIRFSEYMNAVTAPDILPHNAIFRYFIMAMGVLPILSILTGKYDVFAWLYFINLFIIGSSFEKCAVIKKNYSSLALFGRCFFALAGIFSTKKFESPVLTDIAAKFCGAEAGGTPDGFFVRKLGEISGTAAIMQFPIPVILDAVFLFDINMCERVERKVANFRPELLNLVPAIAEFEALSSFAGIKLDQPEYRFASIDDSPEPALSFSGLAHPFIDIEKAVANSISFNSACDIAIITGSNMSGKSTFLKSVSLAAVLSAAGAPVRAMSASLTPVRIITDIRVSDSITLGISHFYSELLRVKMVTDELMKGRMVLGIFDELFHGTNSRERLALCRATLEYLKNTGGRFIVATHDRELTAIASNVSGAAIKNYHFEEKITGVESTFTYKLIDGPSTVTNAIALAQKCGLPEQIYKRARELAGE